MSENRLLKTGLIGSAIAAICCFTPALVIVMGALGLSAYVGSLDIVLLPLLGLCLLMVGVALIRRKSASPEKEKSHE